MENSQLDFSFIKQVCVDNKKIKEKIKKSKDIQISLVPCLLNIFQDGGVEKYEGESIFEWLKNYILSKKQMNAQMNPQMNPQINAQMNPQINAQNVPKTILTQEHFEGDDDEEDEVVKIQKKKPKKIFKVKNSEDEQDNRYRNFEQPKRIRKDQSEYIEDDELFSGDKIENTTNAPKAIAQKNPEINNILSKAKELAQGREETEIIINKPQKR